MTNEEMRAKRKKLPTNEEMLNSKNEWGITDTTPLLAVKHIINETS